MLSQVTLPLPVPLSFARPPPLVPLRLPFFRMPSPLDPALGSVSANNYGSWRDIWRVLALIYRARGVRDLSTALLSA